MKLSREDGGAGGGGARSANSLLGVAAVAREKKNGPPVLRELEAFKGRFLRWQRLAAVENPKFDSLELTTRPLEHTIDVV